jgi:hypothetical protein
MERVVVAALVGVRRDPPADVDVVDEEPLAQRRAPDVGQRVALAELEFVPDEVNVVVVVGDRLGGPAAASCLVDERSEVISVGMAKEGGSRSRLTSPE